MTSAGMQTSLSQHAQPPTTHSYGASVVVKQQKHMTSRCPEEREACSWPRGQQAPSSPFHKMCWARMALWGIDGRRSEVPKCAAWRR